MWDIFKLLLKIMSAALFWYGGMNVGVDVFEKASSGILGVFSIMAGLVAQIMVFTGMLISPERVPAHRLLALEVVLEKQQKYWIRQFMLYLTVVLSVILVQIAVSRFRSVVDEFFGADVIISLVCALVGLAICNAFLMPSRIIGLQRLRFNVIREEVEVRPAVEAGRPSVEATRQTKHRAALAPTGEGMDCKT